MVDIVSEAVRSRMMSGIRATHTKPERVVRSILHRAGLRFRLHATGLPGKPDIVLPKWRTVVFVHGCFWHGHDCHLFKMPSTRTEFWRQKIARNAATDETAIAALVAQNWKVVTVWECALKGRARLSPERLGGRIVKAIRVGHRRRVEIGGRRGA